MKGTFEASITASVTRNPLIIIFNEKKSIKHKNQLEKKQLYGKKSVKALIMKICLIQYSDFS